MIVRNAVHKLSLQQARYVKNVVKGMPRDEALRAAYPDVAAENLERIAYKLKHSKYVQQALKDARHGVELESETPENRHGGVSWSEWNLVWLLEIGRGGVIHDKKYNGLSFAHLELVKRVEEMIQEGKFTLDEYLQHAKDSEWLYTNIATQR